MLEGEIFNAFSAEQRAGIWGRLQLIDCLIPSLYTFFEDINYLQVLVDCLKWLTSISLNSIISTILERAFSKKGSSNPNLMDQYDLGIRKLYVYAMHHFLDMPRDVNTKHALAKATIRVDRMVLQEFAELASHLGFEFPEITKLRKHSHPTTATQSRSSKRLLVENGPGEPKKRRCGLPSRKAYEKDCVFLNLCNIHKKEKIGEGITSFFVRRFVYFAFFRKSAFCLTQEQDEIDIDEIDIDEIDIDIEAEQKTQAERER